MTAKRKPRKHSLDEMWNPGWEAGLEKRTVSKGNNKLWVYPCCFKDLFVLDVLQLDHNLLVFFSSPFSFSLISGFFPLKAPGHGSTSSFLLSCYRSTLNTGQASFIHLLVLFAVFVLSISVLHFVYFSRVVFQLSHSFSSFMV